MSYEKNQSMLNGLEECIQNHNAHHFLGLDTNEKIRDHVVK